MPRIKERRNTMKTLSKILKLLALGIFLLGTVFIGGLILAGFRVDIDRFLNE